MILIFNVFLGPETRWFNYDRGVHAPALKSQICLATLQSYVPVGFKHAFINIELADNYEDAESFYKSAEFMCRAWFGNKHTFSRTDQYLAAWNHAIAYDPRADGDD